jgi:2-polyprenyl-3-methyl-5-hydroxy-6-metoxy-1,4-benzoquinol methylase
VRIIRSSEYYDQLAADYRQISQSRAAYLAGIDRLIAESLRPGLSLLDVGGADGVRSRRLARDAGISRVTLVDSSPAMLSRVESADFEQVIEGDITSEATLAQLGEARFDAALILWNVLGHIPTPEARLCALANIHRALHPNGLLFLDCNNRENMRAYGWAAACRNWLLGLLTEGGERWNFPLPAKNAADAVSYVHIFSLRELKRLAAAAGFEIDCLAFVDYKTGQPVKSRFEGQVFLQLRKPGQAIRSR